MAVGGWREMTVVRVGVGVRREERGERREERTEIKIRWRREGRGEERR